MNEAKVKEVMERMAKYNQFEQESAERRGTAWFEMVLERIERLKQEVENFQSWYDEKESFEDKASAIESAVSRLEQPSYCLNQASQAAGECRKVWQTQQNLKDINEAADSE